MPLERIDHVAVTTTDIAATRSFYRDVLGLREGPRPPFGQPGAWMYLGEHPALHISTRRAPTSRKSDALDHVAFAASGLAQMRARLQAAGVDFVEFAVPERQLLQLFLADPDGTEIELVFSGEEALKAIHAGVAADRTRPAERPTESKEPAR